MLSCSSRLSLMFMYTSLTIEEDEESSSEDTVEMVAAIGPMIMTPAQKGVRLCTMAIGMMLSTLLP